MITYIVNLYIPLYHELWSRFPRPFHVGAYTKSNDALHGKGSGMGDYNLTKKLDKYQQARFISGM